MALKRYARTLQIVNKDDFIKVGQSRIIIFGVGGVGGQALESLVRAGFKHITIVDRDVVEETNLNRQLIATVKTLGKPKVMVAKERMLEIDPEVTINTQFVEITEENITSFTLESYDFVVDAIDSFCAKMALIKYCLSNNIPLISAMGAGNRLDPTKIVISDIFKTSGDPLAKKIRAELRKANLKGLTVVSSAELPHENIGQKPGSSPFVPAASGLAIASYIFINVIGK